MHLSMYPSTGTPITPLSIHPYHPSTDNSPPPPQPSPSIHPYTHTRTHTDTDTNAHGRRSPSPRGRWRPPPYRKNRPGPRRCVMAGPPHAWRGRGGRPAVQWVGKSWHVHGEFIIDCVWNTHMCTARPVSQNSLLIPKITITTMTTTTTRLVRRRLDRPRLGVRDQRIPFRPALHRIRCRSCGMCI